MPDQLDRAGSRIVGGEGGDEAAQQVAADQQVKPMQPQPRNRTDGDRDGERNKDGVRQPRVEGQIRPVNGERRQENEEQNAGDGQGAKSSV